MSARRIGHAHGRAATFRRIAPGRPAGGPGLAGNSGGAVLGRMCVVIGGQDVLGFASARSRVRRPGPRAGGDRRRTGSGGRRRRHGRLQRRAAPDQRHDYAQLDNFAVLDRRRIRHAPRRLPGINSAGDRHGLRLPGRRRAPRITAPRAERTRRAPGHHRSRLDDAEHGAVRAALAEAHRGARQCPVRRSDLLRADRARFPGDARHSIRCWSHRGVVQGPRRRQDNQRLGGPADARPDHQAVRPARPRDGAGVGQCRVPQSHVADPVQRTFHGGRCVHHRGRPAGASAADAATIRLGPLYGRRRLATGHFAVCRRRTRDAGSRAH